MEVVADYITDPLTPNEPECSPRSSGGSLLVDLRLGLKTRDQPGEHRATYLFIFS